MNRLRGLAAVGSLATLVDVSVLVALRLETGMPVLVADSLSIGVAATVAWLLYRRVVFAGDPQFRWVRQPITYVTAVLVGGVVDVAVLRVAVAVTGSTAMAPLLAGKAVSLAAAAVVRVAALRNAVFALVHRELDEPAARPEPEGRLRATVVIPAYKAEAVIGATVTAVLTELGDVATSGGLEVLVVDDGSGDGTAAAAAAAGARVVVQPVNRGKGAAVRAGMQVAHGRYRVFTDADLSYSPDQLRAVLHELEAGWDVVVGSRHHTDAMALVQARQLRELSSRVFNLFTSLALLGRYRDTQCGLKGFRADVADLIFTRCQIDGFAFDVEVLHLVERYGLSMREVPVRLRAAEASTVRVGVDALRMVRDVLRVRRAGARGDYDVDVLPLPARV